MELKIEYMDPADLVPYEGNARSHAEEDVSAIVESIKAFGFNDPIGIWKGNLIIEGHGRLIAAKRLGMKTVPCIRLDELTDEERRAYALAHNKTAELSGWNWQALESELHDLTEAKMSRFGFDEETDIAIDNLFDSSDDKEKEPKRIQCPECGEWFEV